MRCSNTATSLTLCAHLRTGHTQPLSRLAETSPVQSRTSKEEGAANGTRARLCLSLTRLTCIFQHSTLESQQAAAYTVP